MNTSVKRCDCRHSYQDEKYGKGMRVHNNKRKEQGKEQKSSCTVCGKEK